jgi:carboxyl-terminal processing protease
MQRARGMVTSVVLVCAIVSGGWFMQRGLGVAAGFTGTPVDGALLFQQVAGLVQERFVEPVTDSMLYRKSVEGLIRELGDPHTVFLSQDRLLRLNESTTGRYAGVGLRIDVRDGWITVVSPLAGGPAREAGVQSGDRIVEIDGRDAHRWTAEEAQRALRGNPGAPVRLLLERAGSPARIPLSITRREIRVAPVENALLLSPGVGYVDLNSFTEQAVVDMRRAVDSLYRAGARALILDLRGDPGGLLDEGVAISDLFLDQGLGIVSMRGRTPEVNREFRATTPQQWPQLMVAVLVDSGSASASEIVAGALQDHDRALVVGTSTFGKGSAQSLFSVPGGGALKLTIARWYTPLGRSINRDAADSAATASTTSPAPSYRTAAGRVIPGGGGIRPDVLVSDTLQAERQRALVAAIGPRAGAYRDALAQFAGQVKASGLVTQPDFIVTPAMRDSLLSALRSRGIDLPPLVVQRVGPLLDDLAGAEVARYVFGTEAEAARMLARDPMIRATLSLINGATSQADLLRRGAAPGGR